MYGPILGVMLTSAAFLVATEDPHAKPNGSENPIAELAGEYSFSNGFSGELLRITPNGRFTLDYFCCTGGGRMAAGGAKFVDGRLALRPNLVRRILASNTPTDLFPIRWGDRLYLVPSAAGSVFCSHVNVEGAEGPPGRGFYLRRGDSEKPVDGLPSVPKEWENMLLTGPLNGKIVEVMKNGRARVDFGYESGAWKGMTLWAKCDGWPWVNTVAVHATNCVIEFYDREAVFKLGDSVSSKRPQGN
jgi:hypothetical protein